MFRFSRICCLLVSLFSFESFANDEAIDVSTLNEYLINGTPCFVLDVREKKELEICCLNNIMHIPLNELLSGAVDGLPKDVLLIVMCRSGIRSQKAFDYLKNNGFDKAVNLKDGILAWIKEIDPTLTAY
ncbi:MAG: rhodanese-like domain-containing protein [Alphaproteobacteria bacterium]|nr:rhodanese-like domain-containing protein [Alphaproteobacteria bacterium]